MKTPLRSLLLALSLALSFSPGLRAADEAFPFKEGDRWCVLGDSITHRGSYHQEVELFYVTRFPENNLEVINCGIGGDSASPAMKRLGWDCLDHKPTVVSVMFGMNDVKRKLYEATNVPSAQLEELKAKTDQAYIANMAELTRRITNSGARLILITPSIFDDTGELKGTNCPGCAAALGRYANEVRSLAVQRGASLVDFNGPMTAINAAVQKTNASATIVGPDRIHPGFVGHFIMAYEFLKAQKVRGTVSLIGIDARTGKPAGCEECEVTDVAVSPNEVSFKCLEKSLPYPVTGSIKPALELVPFMEEFNRETLRVTGLAPGSYSVSIDDVPVRTFTAEELAAGVNLASLQTPQVKQALGVLEILKKKWETAVKLRNIAAFEYRAWSDNPHAATPEEQESMKAKIQAWLEKNTNAQSVAMAADYDKNKPIAVDLNKAATDAALQAHAAAKPFPHRFVIKKAAPAAP